jgi:hypothetical protein
MMAATIMDLLVRLHLASCLGLGCIAITFRSSSLFRLQLRCFVHYLTYSVIGSRVELTHCCRCTGVDSQQQYTLETEMEEGDHI